MEHGVYTTSAGRNFHLFNPHIRAEFFVGFVLLLLRGFHFFVFVFLAEFFSVAFSQTTDKINFATKASLIETEYFFVSSVQ